MDGKIQTTEGEVNLREYAVLKKQAEAGSHMAAAHIAKLDRKLDGELASVTAELGIAIRERMVAERKAEALHSRVWALLDARDGE
jgi:hypothetical protein